ncbi:MAG TPA: GNAT family N-acetyltransferase [Actinomycetota bacterium]
MSRIAHLTTVDLTLRFLLLGQLRRLRDEGHEVVGISAPGPWVADLEREGIRHVPWPHATRSWDPRGDLRALRELVGILRRESFDLVHTHNPKPGILGRLAARAAGVPCVANTVHGLYATPQDRLMKRAAVLSLEWLAAWFSDLELYQSEEDLLWARRRRLVDPPRSVLLGNGTDLSRFDPSKVDRGQIDELRRDLGIRPDEIVVGTIGRMVAEKGYRELFRAAEVVRLARPKARFLVVGERDPEKADSLSEEEIARAKEHVAFAGWRTDVPELLAAMDMFILPSWREGMPRSAIEAAAMGRPLVLTDIRGCREVVRHDEEGLLVPPRAPGRLAEAIVRLIDDPGLRERMGRDARARAIERFDERKVVDRVAAETTRLLVRKTRGDGRTWLRPATSGDAGAMARLHRESMPTAFLPTLGDGFLRQLYEALISDPQGVALVVEREGRVLGFATGVPSVPRFFRRFALRRGVRAFLSAAPRLASGQVRRRMRETAAYPEASVSLPPAELLSIAVAPGARAKGVGRALAGGVLTALGRRGATEVKVVVGADDEDANRFYERVGFRLAARLEVHAGTASNVWVRDVGAERRPEAT